MPCCWAQKIHLIITFLGFSRFDLQLSLWNIWTFCHQVKGNLHFLSAILGVGPASPGHLEKIWYRYQRLTLGIIFPHHLIPNKKNWLAKVFYQILIQKSSLLGSCHMQKTPRNVLSIKRAASQDCVSLTLSQLGSSVEVDFLMQGCRPSDGWCIHLI